MPLPLPAPEKDSDESDTEAASRVRMSGVLETSALQMPRLPNPWAAALDDEDVSSEFDNAFEAMRADAHGQAEPTRTIAGATTLDEADATKTAVAEDLALPGRPPERAT